MSTHTPEGMLSFPHLFTPRPASLGAEPRYSCCLVFDQPAQKSLAYKQLRQDVAEAIDRKWGPGKSKDATFMRGIRSPFRDAADKSYAGYEAGKVFIQAWTKDRPGVVDGGTESSPPRPITAPSDVWAGQTARCSVIAFAYENSGNKGVSFMLNNVQITDANKPRMDGRKKAEDDFPSVGKADPDNDPMF